MHRYLNQALTIGTSGQAWIEGLQPEQEQTPEFALNRVHPDRTLDGVGRDQQPLPGEQPIDLRRRLLLGGLAASLVLLGAPLPAFALSLDDARNQGLVGERRDGYIGVVRGGVGVDALVSSVNAQRRAEYERTARDTGRSLSEVEAIAGQQLIGRARGGWYVQDSGGGWRKK